MINILYQDKDLLAIEKPAGLLVHKSNVAMDITENAVDLLTKQLGQDVFPIHRLDRPTSGILLFALNANTAKLMADKMQNNQIHKWYVTIVRGKAAASGHITKALGSEYSNTVKDAISYYKTLKHGAAPFPYRGFPTTLYSVVLASPQTGRTHQLRQHFAHIRHYIIGDKKHGDVKQNKLLTQHGLTHGMYLHACHISFTHPIHGKNISITSFPPSSWDKFAHILDINWKELLSDSTLSCHPPLFALARLKEQQSTHNVYGG